MSRTQINIASSIPTSQQGLKPYYDVKCPSCDLVQIYVPRTGNTIMNYAKFTCEDCKKRNNVLCNQIIIKKKHSKRSRKGITREEKGRKGKKEEENDLLALPEFDPSFKQFCRWWSYPAYRGLFEWQLVSHELLWPTKFSMELVHRKAGKSIKYCAEYEWAILYQNFDVLLLGWTDRRKEIALYVYTFFLQRDLIEQDKRTSPYHFRTKNGGKFDCYLITGKETLGMHAMGRQDRFVDLDEFEKAELMQLLNDYDEDIEFGPVELEEFIKSREGSERKLWISIDDPIDITFMKERYREKTLEMRFDSTLYSIDPDKWTFTGTHKFQGDIFDYWTNKFGTDLVKYVRGPINKDGTLLCPELYTHPSLATYQDDLAKGKKCLVEIRKHVGEYAYHSEWCQDPHPVTGEIWDHLVFDDLLDTPVNIKYDLCYITIDRATTVKIESSYTGCFVGLRHTMSGIRVITHDFTQKIALEELLIKINNFLIRFRETYRTVRLILIVEKQGGGDDFITLARTRIEFTQIVKGKLIRIPNKIPELAIIIEIHNTGEKLQRIEDRLTAPLNNERIHFISTLQGSEGVQQVLNFPNSAYLDAPDCLANAEFVLLDYEITGGLTRVQNLQKAYRRKVKDLSEEEQFEVEKRLKQEEILKRNIKKRSVFEI